MIYGIGGALMAWQLACNRTGSIAADVPESRERIDAYGALPFDFPASREYWRIIDTAAESFGRGETVCKL